MNEGYPPRGSDEKEDPAEPSQKTPPPAGFFFQKKWLN